MHRDLPGHENILQREYTLADESSNGDLIDRESWDGTIKAGMSIGLSMILRKESSSSRNGTSCPRCNKQCTVLVLSGQRLRW
jgi:hypothetical protein